MAENQAVSARVKETLDLAARCFEAENSKGYQVLGEQLDELSTLTQDTVREHEDCRSILRKLDSGQALTPGELNTVKLRMVGDAEYYLRFDDDFDRSKGELKRILEEISKLQSSDLDLEGMMHLEVLCREACSVAKPTAFYLEQKDRVRKFEDATRDGIDSETAKTLADILRGI